MVFRPELKKIMQQLNGTILVVDDDEDILLALKMLLKRHGALVHTEPDPTRIPSRMKEIDYDVILLDMNFSRDANSGEEGFYWLEKILEISPATVVLMITAYGDVEMAVKATKAGSADFILKPWQNEKLLATVHSALKLSASKYEIEELRSRQEVLFDSGDPESDPLLGISPPMLKLFSLIDKVADTDADILVLGENGTGKELVARALHRKSSRANQVFVGVDVGSLPETLFESELFGYAKGAFTDARKDRPGRFEVASGGTLFLDEIGNISIAQQAKLLRVLETRQVIRTGENKPRSIDVRLICATNRPVDELVAAGEFRQDLLYRINTVELVLPPLKERKEDISVLAKHFLAKFEKKYRKSPMKFAVQTLKSLERHSWPGNVRELRHAVERAVILSDSTTLHPSDFFLKQDANVDGELQLSNFNLDDCERKIILRVMEMYQGNIQKAAKELGLSRPALYRRIEKYGL